MNYFKALALLSYVTQALAAVAEYKVHKSPQRLAGSLSAALLGALHANGLALRVDASQTREIVEAVEVVLDIVEEK